MQKIDKPNLYFGERQRQRERLADRTAAIIALKAEVAMQAEENKLLAATNSVLVNKLNTARFELARERGEYDPARSTSPFIREQRGCE